VGLTGLLGLPLNVRITDVLAGFALECATVPLRAAAADNAAAVARTPTRAPQR
jgi:hypothetical protein